MDLSNQLTGREYMALKRQKHNNTNSDAPSVSSLFAGCVIYVNGHTEPNQNELRDLVVAHGGAFVFQPSHTATHVIATTLSDVKMGKLKPTDKVLRPLWILDCIKEQKLLSTPPYDLQRNELAANMFAGRSVALETREDDLDASLTSKNPKFLMEYFRNSRLHHLSHWRAEFQEKLSSVLLELDVKNPIADQEAGVHSMAEPIVMHVDMDCFFASVAMRHDPMLYGRPVAVCHNTEHGEVSACSYEAKKFGVTSGMYVKDAIRLCPNLVCVPYQFDLYEKASRSLFEILIGYTRKLEIISCDEAFLNVTDCMHNDWKYLPHEERAHAIAKHIRNDIFEATGCPASVGISYNLLLARMATRRAKPNGQFMVTYEGANAFLWDTEARDLPGVGSKTMKQLAALGVATCGDLYELDREVLQKTCGPKRGEKLWNYARGTCHQEIESYRMRKNVGLMVNYAIRFEEESEVMGFIEQISQELERRLKKRKGRLLTLKIMLKRPGWHAPSKFLGHGLADSFQKSITTNAPLDNLAGIVKRAKTLYRAFEIKDASDLVGIGISMGKLEDPLSKLELAAARAKIFNSADAVSNEPVNEVPPSEFGATEQQKPPLALAKRVAKKSEYARVSMADVDMSFLDELPPAERKLQLAELALGEAFAAKRASSEAASIPAAPNRIHGGSRVEDSIDPQVWAALGEDTRRDLTRGIVATKPARQSTLKAVRNMPLQQARLAKMEPRPAKKGAASPPKKSQPYAHVEEDEIDPDVFNALPAELQAELTRDLEHNRLKKRSKKETTSSNVPAALETTFLGTEEREELVSKTVDIYQARYKSWRHAFPEILAALPVEENVRAISDNLFRFVEAWLLGCNLEDAECMLRDLRKFVDQRDSDEWNAIWNHVISPAQKLVMVKYSSVLPSLGLK